MPIHEQEQAYKRGVVLGLTLAEVVILVLFCLLLLFAASWKILAAPQGEGQHILREMYAEMEAAGGPKSIDEFWKELRRVYRDERNRERQKTVEQSPDEVQRRVISEMEAMRGAEALDEFWRKLKSAHYDAESKARTATQLEKDKNELEQAKAALESKVKALEESVRSLEQQKLQMEQANARLGQRVEELARKLRECEHERAALSEELNRVKAQLSQCAQREEAQKGHTWPPIIKLKEAEGYFFLSGDARLSKEFEEKLRALVPAILDHIKRYNVDVVEVVGHTDEVPLAGRQSNLDGALLPYLNAEKGGPSAQRRR